MATKLLPGVFFFRGNPALANVQAWTTANLRRLIAPQSRLVLMAGMQYFDRPMKNPLANANKKWLPMQWQSVVNFPTFNQDLDASTFVTNYLKESKSSRLQSLDSFWACEARTKMMAAFELRSDGAVEELGSVAYVGTSTFPGSPLAVPGEDPFVETSEVAVPGEGGVVSCVHGGAAGFGPLLASAWVGEGRILDLLRGPLLGVARPAQMLAFAMNSKSVTNATLVSKGFPTQFGCVIVADAGGNAQQEFSAQTPPSGDDPEVLVFKTMDQTTEMTSS